LLEKNPRVTQQARVVVTLLASKKPTTYSAGKVGGGDSICFRIYLAGLPAYGDSLSYQKKKGFFVFKFLKSFLCLFFFVFCSSSSTMAEVTKLRGGEEREKDNIKEKERKEKLKK